MDLVEEKAEVLGRLAEATGAKELGALLKRARELRVDEADARVAAAAATLAKLQKQLEIANRAPGVLDRARDSRDVAEILALLAEAEKHGVPAADVADCAAFAEAMDPPTRHVRDPPPLRLTSLSPEKVHLAARWARPHPPIASARRAAARRSL